MKGNRRNKEGRKAKGRAALNPTVFTFCLLALVFFAVSCAVGFAGKSDGGNLAGTKRSDLRLWYREPARKWTEALPIGNGRLGAMVFGGIENETEGIRFLNSEIFRNIMLCTI